MNPASAITYLPRKTPSQERSEATVAAIKEATIQVLLAFGLERFTTTRVAERAGVSIGTLYQYFPNKQSLLFALLEDHANSVAENVEAVCHEARGQPLAAMMNDFVHRFVDAKMARTDISMALYHIAATGGAEPVRRMIKRMHHALIDLIKTAPDIELPPDRSKIDFMLAAMAGATRSFFETGTSPAAAQNLRRNLVLFCQTYIAAVTDPSARGKS